ncbi:MAG: cytochrome b/b6 domain-containing protein [Bdellovibrionales bacterium]
MRNQLVYDLPMRLFHWVFATLFVAAFLIAKTVDDESTLFSYHMLAGLLLGFVVTLRLVWGFVGSKHSRFSGFALHPRELVAYFTGILSGDKRKWSGHNPASSWATLIMFALALGLGLTGYLMASGQKETFEDIHELLANGFLVVVLMHIAGIILHALRHQDGIAFSMIDGSKKGTPSGETITSSRPAVAILFVGLVATFAVHLATNFNSQTRTLNLFGNQLQLGENEENEGSESGESKGEADENDEDDND